jgi:hypothetical protein
MTDVKKPNVVYKLDEKLKKDIEIYLNTRPFAEVDKFLTSMFEIDDKDPYYLEDGIKALFKYLSTCPRKEVKELLDRTKTEIHQFELSEKKEEGK